MEKAILLPLTYLIGIAELSLGVFFWATHSKSEIRKVMALLSLSTGLWVVFSAMLAYRNNFSEGALIINACVYVFGMLLLTSLVHLAIIFPKTLWRLDSLHKVLIYLPVIILAAIAFSTRLLELNYISDAKNVGKVVAGPLLPFYNSWLLLLFVMALALLWKQRRESDGFMRQNVQLLMAAVFVGGMPAVYVDLIVPIVNADNVPNFLIGVLGSCVWFAMTVYVVIKR